MAYEFETAKVALEEVKSRTFFLGTGKLCPTLKSEHSENCAKLIECERSLVMLCRSKIAFLLVMFVLLCLLIFNLVNMNCWSMRMRTTSRDLWEARGQRARTWNPGELLLKTNLWLHPISPPFFLYLVQISPLLEASINILVWYLNRCMKQFGLLKFLYFTLQLHRSYI